ncbi:MAG: hypothetical protein MUO91_09280 [candidate division Zixibacteria bacterium]|nr:hypothetical protein [candidate division Zixibacteria bacterium]
MEELLNLHVSIAEIILIITLFVLIWQTWLLRKTIKSNTFQSIYDRYFDVDRILIDYPEFQKYVTREEVYEKIKDSSVEKLREKSFIELVLDLCELIYYQKKMGTYPAEITYIDRVLTNPHIKEYWKSVRGTYKSDFVKYVEKCLSEQEQRSENKTK